MWVQHEPLRDIFPLYDIYLLSLMHEELLLFKFSSNTWCNIFNKKAFQYAAYHLLANRTCFGAQVNKIEQVSSDYHQLLPAGGRSHVWAGIGVGPISQCIMDNGPMGTPPRSYRMTDKHLWKHYLPSTVFAGAGNNLTTMQHVCKIAEKDSN